MKVLMFSTDASAFEEHSAFRKRLIEYGELFDAVHVIVFSGPQFHENAPSKKSFLYPTRSRMGVVSLIRTFFIGMRILKESPTEFVITAQEEFSGLIAFFLSRRFNIPWQAQIHSDIASPYFSKFSYRNALRVRIARFILPRASCIRVVGTRTKTALEENGIARHVPISVLPISIDAQRRGSKNYEDSPFDFVVLMVSRLSAEKNIDLALRAFGRLIRKYSQTTLRIVGNGPERARLEALAKNLDLGAHVQFEGRQENPSPYYVSAHAFLSTSWYEGYGMSVVEAMAAGLPIVMTDTGVAGDMVKNGISGLVVPVNDEDALFEALYKIRSSAEIRKQMGVAAQHAMSNLPSRSEYLAQFQQTLLTCKLPEKN